MNALGRRGQVPGSSSTRKVRKRSALGSRAPTKGPVRLHGGRLLHGTREPGHALLPMLNMGELAVLYCFVFLYFFFAGAGAWSVDAMRRRA